MFSPCPQVALECELELMKGWRVQDECDPVIIRVMARMISRTVDLLTWSSLSGEKMIHHASTRFLRTMFSMFNHTFMRVRCTLTTFHTFEKGCQEKKNSELAEMREGLPSIKMLLIAAKEQLAYFQCKVHPRVDLPTFQCDLAC